MEHVLPEGVPLRQWGPDVSVPMEKTPLKDGKLFSALTRLFVTTVLGFYKEKAGKPTGRQKGQSGAIATLQRTSSDLKAPSAHPRRLPRRRVPRGRCGR